MMQARLHHNGGSVLVRSCDWLAKIESLGARGVIFDCDGTLVDSAAAHCLSLQAAVRDQGFELDATWYSARSGLDRKTLFHQFKNDIAPHLDVAAAIQDSIAQFSVQVEKVIPIRATTDLFRQLSKRGYQLAVVTNAERPVATQSLRRTRLLEKIQELVCITDGFPPKPAPQMFERAAALFDLPANQVVVFEDSPQGVEAATSANMAVFEISEVQLDQD
ncbi:MAG: HAD family hydrolase [Paracoccaceae bacterium]